MSPSSLEALAQAIGQLKRDPGHAVRVRVDDLDVELRALTEPTVSASAAEAFALIGPWEGETTDEILRLLEEARREGTARAVGTL